MKKQLHLDEQILDEKIGSAFHDVSIPPGLDQRIFDILAHARTESLVSTALKAEKDHFPVRNTAVSLPAEGKRKVSRRWLVLSVGIMTAAAVLLIALCLNSRNVDNYTEQSVLDEAICFFDADASQAGFLLTEKSPPKSYTFSRAVLFSKNIRWREIHNLLGRSGIAYDLPCRDGGRATLYVIDLNVEMLGHEPQFRPFTTGGYYTSAWKESGFLYVLVVQGGLQTYQNHLNLHSGPVA